jgi:hypothetical protein
MAIQGLLCVAIAVALIVAAGVSLAVWDMKRCAERHYGL